MQSDNILRSVYETELSAAEQAQADQATAISQNAGLSLGGTSLNASLAPVISFEKTDLMFLMLVIQTALLYLIWRQG